MAGVQLPARFDRGCLVSATSSVTRVRATRHVTLLDLLDRLLGGGVVIQGEITLAAADIDLVELDLGVLVAAIDKLRNLGPAPRDAIDASSRTSPSDVRPAGARAGTRPAGAGADMRPAGASSGRESPRTSSRRFHPTTGSAGRKRSRPLPERVNADPEGLEKGLAQLVLTLIELLRQLMERQALRRIDAGTLTTEEVERLGQTFLALAERMEELKETFGLSDEDLNLNLGPLGDLM